MRRLGACATIVIAAIVMWSSAPAALGEVSPGDASATREYLRLELANAHTELEHFPAAIAAVEALGRSLQAECPGVLANAPKPASGAKPSATEVQIAEEESDAAFGAAEHSEDVRASGLAQALSHLRWSNGALTRLVHSASAEEAAKAAIAPPALCADMRTWVTSGYQTVSTGTESYLRREAALSKDEGAEEVIMRELARYESQADRRTVQKLADLERSALPALVSKVLAALGKVSEALGTPAAAPAG